MIGLIEAFFAYILFWIIIYLIYEFSGLKRENLIIKPFFLQFKTSLLNNWMKKLANYRRELGIKLLNVGIIVGIGLIVFGIYFLIRNLNMLFAIPEQAASFVLLIPGLTIGVETLPYIIIALFLAFITHEFAHGIASLVDGVPIKSSGILFAIVFPGAFVEIDERRLNKTKLLTRLRVFAAGAYANIIMGIIVLLLLTNFALTISPFYNSDSSGVLITELVDNGAAEQAGLKAWDVIYTLNGSNIEGVNGLRNFMVDLRPNTLLIANASSGVFKIKTQPHTANSSKAAVGIYPFVNFEPNFNWLPRSLPYHIYWVEWWASTLLIWLALFNMIPIYPLDGDRFLNSLFEKLLPNYSKFIRIPINVFCFIILASNFVISTSIFGLIRV